MFPLTQESAIVGADFALEFFGDFSKNSVLTLLLQGF